MANITLIRGDSYHGDRRLRVVVVGADGTTAADISAVDLAFMVKRHTSDADADALVSKATGSGITLETDGTDGVARISIDPSDTADGPVGLFRWELQGTDADGVVTLASGAVKITADLIRGS